MEFDLYGLREPLWRGLERQRKSLPYDGERGLFNNNITHTRGRAQERFCRGRTPAQGDSLKKLLLFYMNSLVF